MVTPFLPGDSLLFAVGALAALPESRLDVFWVFVLLSLAALCGDNVNYWIGYTLGPKVFRAEGSRLLNKKHLERTHKFTKSTAARRSSLRALCQSSEPSRRSWPGSGGWLTHAFCLTASRARCCGWRHFCMPDISSATFPSSRKLYCRGAGHHLHFTAARDHRVFAPSRRAAESSGQWSVVSGSLQRTTDHWPPTTNHCLLPAARLDFAKDSLAQTFPPESTFPVTWL